MFFVSRYFLVVGLLGCLCQSSFATAACVADLLPSCLTSCLAPSSPSSTALAVTQPIHIAPTAAQRAALARLEISAKAGNAHDQCDLGTRYLKGIGGAVMDVTRGLELIQASADKGFAAAQGTMAEYFHERKQYAEAITWYERIENPRDLLCWIHPTVLSKLYVRQNGSAARLHDGFVRIADYYWHEGSLSEDMVEALKEIAGAENATADLRRHIEIFQRAVGGHARSQYALGQLYWDAQMMLNSSVSPQQLVLMMAFGLNWYTRAADQGHKEAISQMGFLTKLISLMGNPQGQDCQTVATLSTVSGA